MINSDWNYKRSTMTQIKDASQLESMEQSIASLTKTIAIIENHYKLKINEMENKVKDLQSGKLLKIFFQKIHFSKYPFFVYWQNG